MNRIVFYLSLLLATTGQLAAEGQTVPPPAPAPQADVITESGKISRFVAGPGDRPQGLLLHNGTFVSLSPGLSQQLPASLPREASVKVAGNVLTYAGSRTIEAHDITIAGVTYTEGAPSVIGGPVPPPPPSVATGPLAGGSPAPAPPPPCGVNVPQPPPAFAPGTNAPPPPDGAPPAPSPQVQQ